MSKTALAERIAAARNKAGLSQAEVADRLGISQQAYQYYESRAKDIKGDIVKSLCRVLGVSAAYLLGMADDLDATEPAPWVDVPVYGSIAAGVPLDMIAIEEMRAIPPEVAAMYPDAFLLKVKGNSMDRVLPNGSFALVNPCKEIDRPGAPYAVCVNGDTATIKRVRPLAHGLELDPDSMDPTYKPKIYDEGNPEDETVTIIGQVVWYTIPYKWDF